jgi:hypothetical protein
MASWVQYFELGTLLAETSIAVVLTPEFLKHRAEHAERLARIGLNIDTFDPRKITQSIYGLDQIAAQIGDLIDRASNPEAYTGLDVGNEILIVGPEQAGKKALALHIAKLIGIRRVIVVYNPRDADVLARAKSMIENRHVLKRRAKQFLTSKNGLPNLEKTMLLLPGLDPANRNTGEAWHDQLEALIETASSLPHVLVVGTAKTYERNGEVASWFGTVLPLPKEKSPAWDDLIQKITEGFLDSAAKAHYQLSGIERADFINRILAVRPNPAEVKDIFAQCETLATSRRRQKQSADLVFTPEILAIAIERVIPEAFRTFSHLPSNEPSY